MKVETTPSREVYLHHPFNQFGLNLFPVSI